MVEYGYISVEIFRMSKLLGSLASTGPASNFLYPSLNLIIFFIFGNIYLLIEFVLDMHKVFSTSLEDDTV